MIFLKIRKPSYICKLLLQESYLSPNLYSDTEESGSESEEATDDDESYEDEEPDDGSQDSEIYTDEETENISSGSNSRSYDDGDSTHTDEMVCPFHV